MQPRSTKKVLQDFFCQEGISHKVTKRCCPEANGLPDRVKLIIMDKVSCMLIDAKLTRKLWTYLVHHALLLYNGLFHSSLDNHKSPNDAYGDCITYWSSTSSLSFSMVLKLPIFCRISRNDQKNKSFLELNLLATNSWMHKEYLFMWQKL